MGFPRGVKRDFEALEKRRLEAIRLIVDEGLSQSEAARRVGAAQQSVNGWVKRYREEGRTGLVKAPRAGRPRMLSEEQRTELETLLLEGPEAHGFPTPLWTCPRVAGVIRERFGVDYHEGHVWRLLRGLNWSAQRPAGKARERNEEAILEWKRKTWPAVKKKRGRKAAQSFSSTRAD
jgi:transposase